MQYLTSYCDNRPTGVRLQKACIITVGPLGSSLQSKQKVIKLELSEGLDIQLLQKSNLNLQKGNYWQGCVICCTSTPNPHTRSWTSCMKEGISHTSSLLDPILSRAIGLFGALLAVGAASGAELDCGTGDTPRVWVTAMLPRVVERYCFTCCLCACWMWYLVGFSKWVCT